MRMLIHDGLHLFDYVDKIHFFVWWVTAVRTHCFPYVSVQIHCFVCLEILKLLDSTSLLLLSSNLKHLEFSIFLDFNLSLRFCKFSSSLHHSCISWRPSSFSLLFERRSSFFSLLNSFLDLSPQQSKLLDSTLIIWLIIIWVFFRTQVIIDQAE